MTPQQILSEFWELPKGCCALDLENGEHHEGYLLEVQDQNIVFGEGGPCAPDEDFLISIEDVDLGTLYFWSESQRAWFHAQWNEDAATWHCTPYQPIPKETLKDVPPEKPPLLAVLWSWLKKRACHPRRLW